MDRQNDHSLLNEWSIFVIAFAARNLYNYAHRIISALTGIVQATQYENGLLNADRVIRYQCR
jgi:hypothetical protein